MSESRNRWIVRVVLAFAVVAFLGVSIMPIITAVNKPQSSPQNQQLHLIYREHLINKHYYKSYLQD